MVKLASSDYLAGTNSYHIESDGVDGLPQGWARASLSDIVEPGTERVAPATMPTARYIGMEHVEAHTNKILATVPAASMASSAAVFAAGNVLYGRMRPYLNKVVRPEFSGLASAEFIVFPQSPALDLDFLLMRLSASDFVRFACSQYEGDRPRVKFEQLGKFTLSLPPLAEQTRIVAKLEELLSDLDAGVAELKAAQAKLAQYRQSLLKAAVNGGRARPAGSNGRASPPRPRTSRYPKTGSINTPNLSPPTLPACPNCRRGGCGRASRNSRSHNATAHRRRRTRTTQECRCFGWATFKTATWTSAT